MEGGDSIEISEVQVSLRFLLFSRQLFPGFEVSLMFGIISSKFSQHSKACQDFCAESKGKKLEESVHRCTVFS